MGVGQDELEITRMAHTTLVVMAPGLGDDDAGEQGGPPRGCADVFAVNKADREADGTVRDLELMISLGGEITRAGAHGRDHRATAAQEVRHADGVWVPRITRTVATKNQGIDDEACSGCWSSTGPWLADTELGAARRAGPAQAR